MGQMNGERENMHNDYCVRVVVLVALAALTFLAPALVSIRMRRLMRLDLHQAVPGR